MVNDSILVYFDGRQLFALSFGMMGDSLVVEPKTFQIAIRKLTGESIFNTTLVVEDMKFYTSLFYGDSVFKMDVATFVENKPADLLPGTSAIRIIQLGSLLNTSFAVSSPSPSSPPSPSLSFPSMPFSSSTSYSPLRSDYYDITATPTATPSPSLPIKERVNLTPGGTFTAIFLPTLFRVYEDFDFKTIHVRVVHASPDVPSLYVSGLGFPLLYREETPVMPLHYAEGNLLLVQGGNTTLKFSFPYLPFANQSVIIYGLAKPPKNNTNSLRGSVVVDPVVDPTMATVSFGNFVPDVPSLRLVFANETYSLTYGPSGLVTLNRGPGVYEIALYKSGDSRRRRGRRGGGDGDVILKRTITLELGTLSNLFAEGTDGNIVLNTDPDPTQAPTTSPPSSSGLSGGAIAGIVIGCVFGALLIAGVVFYFFRGSSNNGIDSGKGKLLN